VRTGWVGFGFGEEPLKWFGGQGSCQNLVSEEVLYADRSGVGAGFVSMACRKLAIIGLFQVQRILLLGNGFVM